MMKKNTNKVIISLILISTVLAGSANADRQINIGGATLFEDFFRAQASTKDVIDVDGDGVSGTDPEHPFGQQLADTWNSTSWDPYWVVQYRGIGSGSGLYELATYYNTAPTYDEPSDIGLCNRVPFWEDGVAGPAYTPGNPSGAPVAPDNVDISVMDVPTTWFTMAGDANDAYYLVNPTVSGYGCNPIINWDSNDVGSQKNTLKDLLGLNTNVTNPDANTVFDTPIAYVPIAFIANTGAGITDGNVTQNQLQYLFLTGRMPNGENLIAATRDSGSGTRNGGMNGIGMDPSWGRGDNMGKKVEITQKLGPDVQTSSLGGSSIMESVIERAGLAVGYTGFMGSSRAATDASGGKYEILNVMKDIAGAAQYVRPSVNNCVYNDSVDTGWQIGGNETMATVGEPDKTSAYKMLNDNAIDYMNNITESIENFVSSGGTDPNHFMPGEFLAQNFVLTAAASYMPDPLNPKVWVDNNPVASLQTYTVNNNYTADFGEYGSQLDSAGKVPTRDNSYSYPDDAGGSQYKDSSDTMVNYGTTLSKRNAVLGDFLYDGVRNMDDIEKMIEAYNNWDAFENNNNNGGDGYVIVHLIGDFDGNGQFDINDVRYFADGLAIDTATGKLNRAAGFAAIDDVSGGNFFGTTPANGTYNNGDSRADVTGAAYTAPGSAPVGADGKIDANDIDYINYVLRKGYQTDAFGWTAIPNANILAVRLDWNKKDDAIWMDLSCDMNGDFIIDATDAYIVISQILETGYGDTNLDGDVDSDDIDTIESNLGTQGGWADGDINGDGFVTEADLALAQGQAGSYNADLDGDGDVDFADFAIFSSQWMQGIQ